MTSRIAIRQYTVTTASIDLYDDLGAGSRILSIHSTENTGDILNVTTEHSGGAAAETVAQVGEPVTAKHIVFAWPGLPTQLNVNRDGSEEHVNLSANVTIGVGGGAVTVVYTRDPVDA